MSRKRRITQIELGDTPGSIVCIDPKGEIAAIAARNRRQTESVLVLDPFTVLTPNLKSQGFNARRVKCLSPAR